MHLAQRGHGMCEHGTNWRRSTPAQNRVGNEGTHVQMEASACMVHTDRALPILSPAPVWPWVGLFEQYGQVRHEKPVRVRERGLVSGSSSFEGLWRHQGRTAGVYRSCEDFCGNPEADWAGEEVTDLTQYVPPSIGEKILRARMRAKAGREGKKTTVSPRETMDWCVVWRSGHIVRIC